MDALQGYSSDETDPEDRLFVLTLSRMNIRDGSSSGSINESDGFSYMCDDNAVEVIERLI